MNKQISSIAIAACLIVAPILAPSLHAQSDTSVVADSTESILDSDHSSRASLTLGRVTYLPAIYYSDQNGFGVGGSIYIPLWVNGGHPLAAASNIRFKGRVTSKSRGKIVARFEQGWGNQRHAFRLRLSYINLARRFYGVGPDTPGEAEEEYRPERMRGYVELFHRFTGALRVGIRGEFERVRLREVVAGGALASGAVPGTESGSIYGGGLLFDWSSKDRNYSPTSGSHHQAFIMHFNGRQSDVSDFLVYMVDLRKYFGIAPGHVLATQIFAYVVDDDVAPFWRLASLGGRAHSRGYHRGRYLDRSLLAFQTEYRMATVWRIGLVAFAGLADVASSPGKLKMEHMRSTVGAGIRFRFGSDNAIRGRLDAAFGQNTVRFYVQLGEAF